MFQGFPGDLDTGSRCSSSPSAESQYLSSVDSFGSPPTSAVSQECVSAVGSSSVEGADMPGSFVPTVTAITTSQDLQWMVQPTLVASVAPTQSSAGPPTVTQPQPQPQPQAFDLPGPSYASSPGFTPPSADAPGPSRHPRTRSRRARDETLTPEEEEKRRVRRERNKMAAAKCRNRRRELTDRLQTETDVLEEERAELEAEISELQKEKERLEFVLAAHQPGCKIPYHQGEQQGTVQLEQLEQLEQHSVSVLGLSMKEDAFYPPPAYSLQPTQPSQLGQPTQPTQPGMMQEVAFSSSFYAQNEPANAEACAYDAARGCPPSYTSSFVVTCPAGGSFGVGGGADLWGIDCDQVSDPLGSPSSLLAL
ncbi:hypothetical protein AGOR_G00031250 [Albula goreensis]|uniref:BZIP domain-containing protein n=1 Tax=Albula goreensis TaxID=1534307 RepID=A0A8T3E2W1_9TELE|nr:hypothetical protein AGOR_G00031250 [Albula goreensis]